MVSDNSNLMYQSEIQYNYRKIIILIILLLGVSSSYFFYHYQQSKPIDKLLETMFWLMALIGLSLLHFSVLHFYPHRFTVLRKLIPMAFDLTLLTHLIILWEQKGVFLLIFYILIAMRAGINFGKYYFYTAVIFSLASWAVLYDLTPYWRDHSEFLATFALTTFIVPFFYLDNITQIHQDHQELSNTLEDVSYEAMIDPLTGAYNRKSYEQICQEFINKGEPFALIYIDLNRFKKINDTRGHHVGDMVLKAVTQKLQTLLGEHDIIARLGGDEFVVLASRRYHNIKEFAEKLNAELIGTYIIENEPIHISLSIGIGNFPENGRDRVNLASCADKAMYCAKNTVGRYYYFYDEIKNKEDAKHS
jgi:diguanylate cyclase (GGDEF)-like protein